MSDEPDIRPDKDWLCTEDKCPSFDGKRCEVIGFRPDRFCEPKIDQVKKELKRCRRAALAIDMMDRYGSAFESIHREYSKTNNWRMVRKGGYFPGHFKGIDVTILMAVKDYLELTIEGFAFGLDENHPYMQDLRAIREAL